MLDKKKIMFIGAGKYQLAGIQKAREMGLGVVAIDGNPRAEGLSFADASFAVDIRDAALAISIAREQKVNGVLTVASDAALKTVAAVSESLGLPGINLEVAEKSTDKELMRKCFIDNRLPSPRSYASMSRDVLLKLAREVGFPVVVKPADSAGSRGVRLVAAEDEFEDAFLKAKAYSLKGKVLVEEFMDGVEVSVEAFVYQGEITIIALSDKIRTPPPYLLDTTVIFPSAYPEDIQQSIIEVAGKAIRAIGITFGPVHMELMMTQKGPVPVELAARGPGFKVFTDILPLITGIDILKALIRVSLGQKPDLQPRDSKASALRFFDSSDGIVEEVRGLEDVRRINGIYDVDIYVRPGDKVRALTCGADRVGHIISLAATRGQAIDILTLAEKRIYIKVAKDYIGRIEK